MKFLLVSARCVRRSAKLGLVAWAACLIVTAPGFGQKPAPSGDTSRGRGVSQEEGGKRGGTSLQDMQSRMLSSLRDRLEVTSDEEWTLISQLILKVMEARRSTGSTSNLAFRGGAAQPGGLDKGTRGGRGSARPAEVDALQSAVKDKLPDAEVRARLVRLRESRKTNEAKLEKAQEELRAVLSIRQEAALVLTGLLP